MVLLPEEVGEEGFLESRSPTFQVDSSRKGHAGGPVLRVPTGDRRRNVLCMELILPRRGSGKDRKSPKRTSKNLVPDLLPEMAAQNAESSYFEGDTLTGGRTDSVSTTIYWTRPVFLCLTS
ncbi:hypothetical protein TNCV_4242921 [Trichonephila clavipes]|nr:hypothetical protein TNCV_4242921 [Trichonephila clavipes]